MGMGTAENARVVMGVDPGNTRTAWVVFDGQRVIAHAIEENDEMLRTLMLAFMQFGASIVAIEKIESFGMAVGTEVFDTVFWAGRFYEKADNSRVLVTRKQVKLHLCQSMRAKDANIRQALIDRFGGPAAIGKKAIPGPLYGIKADEWSALAVAVTCHDAIGG